MSTDARLIQRIRDGEPEAWTELIAHFEGRLQTFVERRTGSREAAEDVVQETFVGFLISLPNYDGRQPLENYLFTIASYKLIDYLRRQGRRPTMPLTPGQGDNTDWEPVAHARAASSIVRSGERRGLEEEAIAAALAAQIEHFQQRGQWEKLKCLELLFVLGWPNKDVAAKLGISEKAVASYKFEFIAQLRASVRSRGLPEAVFPQLYS